MTLGPLYRMRRSATDLSKYRIRDESDHIQVSRIFDRYPNRIVQLVAPDGETIMGCVPHEIRHPPLVLYFKRSFFDPYAKD
jgi:hypothetical protein